GLLERDEVDKSKRRRNDQASGSQIDLRPIEACRGPWVKGYDDSGPAAKKRERFGKDHERFLFINRFSSMNRGEKEARSSEAQPLNHVTFVDLWSVEIKNLLYRIAGDEDCRPVDTFTYKIVFAAMCIRKQDCGAMVDD